MDPITAAEIWWHRLRGHTLDIRRVSVPMFDMRARGELVDCSCGKRWAR